MINLNKHQVHFIDTSYHHIYYLRNCLENETKPELRLLYYKELFSVLNENYRMCGVESFYPSIKLLNELLSKRTERQISMETVLETPKNIKKISFEDGIIVDLFRIASFIRNVLAHFPTFRTWDEINLTSEYVTGVSGAGEIYKFLNATHFGRRLILNTSDGQKTHISYPKVSAQETFFLKDIVDEKHGIPILIAALHQYFPDVLESKTDYFNQNEFKVKQ